jgi:shikimate dehydrogenase
MITRQYGLIGYPLSHSFSKGYFTAKFRRENISDAIYDNFPIESIDKFPELVESVELLSGLNVTIPYKEKIIPFLDDLDPVAQAIGAVNTIKVGREKNTIVLKGFNTDVHGFDASLGELLQPNHQKALILGTGGASKAIAHVLDSRGISYLFVSRASGQDNRIEYKDLSYAIMEEYTLVINTTPLGMYPQVESCPPIPYEALNESHLLYDLTYNPELTKFLSLGLSRGTTIQNGLKMLHLQAEKAWEIWNT